MRLSRKSIKQAASITALTVSSIALIGIITTAQFIATVYVIHDDIKTRAIGKNRRNHGK